MSDLIDRQAAIAAIEFDITYVKAINKETGEVTELFKKENEALEKAAERIKQLPSVQLDTYWKEQCQSYEQTINKLRESLSTQPKKGKWIIKDDTEKFIAQCNCCRYIEDSRRINNFCPHCGADMREVST